MKKTTLKNEKIEMKDNRQGHTELKKEYITIQQILMDGCKK